MVQSEIISLKLLSCDQTLVPSILLFNVLHWDECSDFVIVDKVSIYKHFENDTEDDISFDEIRSLLDAIISQILSDEKEEPREYR